MKKYAVIDSRELYFFLQIITVMLPGQTVEFDLVPYTPAVKVNGELVTLPTDSTPFIITEPTTGKELFRFIAKPTTVIMVSMKYGLLLQTSGTSVAIKVYIFPI